MTAEVKQLRPRRRRQPQPGRSHEEIYDLVDRCLSAATAAEQRSRESERRSKESEEQRALMIGTLQRVETKVDAVTAAVGKTDTDERGKLIGTGLAGRLARLDEKVANRFRIYDRWRYVALGGCCTIGPMAAVIWWLTSDRLAVLLRPH